MTWIEIETPQGEDLKALREYLHQSCFKIFFHVLLETWNFLSKFVLYYFEVKNKPRKVSSLKIVCHFKFTKYTVNTAILNHLSKCVGVC